MKKMFYIMYSVIDNKGETTLLLEEQEEKEYLKFNGFWWEMLAETESHETFVYIKGTCDPGNAKNKDEMVEFFKKIVKNVTQEKAIAIAFEPAPEGITVKE